MFEERWHRDDSAPRRPSTFRVQLLVDYFRDELHRANGDLDVAHFIREARKEFEQPELRELLRVKVNACYIAYLALKRWGVELPPPPD